MEAQGLMSMPGVGFFGMLIVGIPYTEPELNSTRSGGAPYGATHVSGTANDRPVSDEESKLAFALGKRLAHVAKRLAP